MIRWLKQRWCARRGHPWPTLTVPIVGQRPDEPETDQTFCQNCGAHLRTEYTDSAGTERRDAVADHTAWLVEMSDGGIPIYFQLKDDDDWTPDHNMALRLPRREDAQQIIDYYGWTSAKPVEHMWVASPTSGASTGGGE